MMSLVDCQAMTTCTTTVVHHVARSFQGLLAASCLQHSCLALAPQQQLWAMLYCTHYTICSSR